MMKYVKLPEVFIRLRLKTKLNKWRSNKVVNTIIHHERCIYLNSNANVFIYIEVVIKV
jgi:hypothetical protein